MGTSFGGSVKLAGESEYRKALKDITSSLKLVSSELKLTNTQFASGDNTLKQTRTSYKSMQTTLEEQKEKVNNLRKALKEAEKEYGSNNEKVKQFKAQLNNAETQLKQMEDATNKSNKELKEMKQGFENAGSGAIKFGDLLKANVFGDMITKGISATYNGIKSIGNALLSTGKQALNSYADYEQFIGGVETLFKNDAGTVEKYANNAYKTSGLSANSYMETVTSFSASLLQSLNNDTGKAAEVANRAIIDMSDNANKMGTSMSSIQYAYQGFAKQNYTMLDNLKLGYGGTKSEMERLIKDASKMKDIQKELGIAVDANSMSFGNIVNAISVVQSKMEIAGTTAKEASTTIQGSVASMKSAWQNMLTGIADDNADFEGLINNLVGSIVTAGQNILPRVEVIIDGMIDLGVQMTGKILEKLPDILEVASDIVFRLIDGITTMIPEISYTVFYIIDEFIKNIISNLPIILQAGIDIFSELINGIIQTLPDIIPVALDAIIGLVTTLLDNIDLIIDSGIQLLLGLTEGLIEAIPRLIEKIPVIIEKMISAIVNNLPKIIEAGINLIVKLGEGLIKAIPALVKNIPLIIAALVKGFRDFIGSMLGIGKNIVEGIWQGISNGFSWIKNKIKGWVGDVLNFIKSLFGIHSPSTVFRDQIGNNLALGIGEGFSDTMKDVSNDMANAIPTEFDVNSSISRQSNNVNLTDALIEAFKQFKPHVILNDKEIGEFAFEYSNAKLGSYI